MDLSLKIELEETAQLSIQVDGLIRYRELYLIKSFLKPFQSVLVFSLHIILNHLLLPWRPGNSFYYHWIFILNQTSIWISNFWIIIITKHKFKNPWGRPESISSVIEFPSFWSFLANITQSSRQGSNSTVCNHMIIQKIVI